MTIPLYAGDEYFNDILARVFIVTDYSGVDHYNIIETFKILSLTVNIIVSIYFVFSDIVKSELRDLKERIKLKKIYIQQRRLYTQRYRKQQRQNKQK